MHAMLFIMLVLVAIVGTALLFVFWLVVTILRAVTRMLFGRGLKPPRVIEAASDPSDTRRCWRDSCRGINPVEARFCRRCGQRLEDPHHVAVRRAAML